MFFSDYVNMAFGNITPFTHCPTHSLSHHVSDSDKRTKKNVRTRATNLVMISNVYLPPKQPLVPDICLSWHFRSVPDNALSS